MKRTIVVLSLIASTCWTVYHFRATAAENATFQTSEFAVIRWDGRENTRLVRPNGAVEKLGPVLQKFPRPDGMDERAYYMAIAMNAVAKEGYDVAAMTSDEVVMRRAVAR